MNPRTVDVTEARPDGWSNIEPKLAVTPVLEKTTEKPIARDDISATLKYDSIFDLQIKQEKTQLHSEYEHILAENVYSLGGEDIGSIYPIGDENEHRITLLARKYAAKHMLPEDAARLDILTQRFRNTMSSITEKDLEIIEGIKKQLDCANELNDRLQEKYK